MMKLDKAKYNHYGFNHDKVSIQFGGELTYIGTWCVKEEPHPVAVYQAANPDTSLGHKDFMLLQILPDPIHGTREGLVRGMTKTEVYRDRYQDGVECQTCREVLYSINLHDYRTCACGDTYVDGGRDYLRYGSKTAALRVQVNLITGEAKYTKSDFRSKKQKEDAMYREAQRKRAASYKTAKATAK